MSQAKACGYQACGYQAESQAKACGYRVSYEVEGQFTSVN